MTPAQAAASPSRLRSASSRVVTAVFCAFFCCVNAGATNISGVIYGSATWTSNNNPYTIVGPTSVATGAVLRIMPGVIVQLPYNRLIVVRGSLYAIGSESNPINFIPAATNAAGGGIAFIGGSHASQATGRVERCVFSNMYCHGSSDCPAADAVVYSDYADIRARNCFMRNYSSDAMRLKRTRFSVANNEIFDVREALNVVYSAGDAVSNNITRIKGHSDGIDVDYAWSGPGSPLIRIEDNRIQVGVDDPGDPNAVDAIDLGNASTNVTIARNVISNFTDKGISIGESSRPRVENNLIRNCNLGIGIKDLAAPTLVNNTIVGCNYGVRIFYKSFGIASAGMTNCIIWDCTNSISLENGSTAQVAYCDIQNGAAWSGTNGNIVADPRFADPVAGDFSLVPASPCVNAGTNQPWGANPIDLAHSPRVMNRTVDMGAYELPGTFLLLSLPSFVAESSGILTNAGQVRRLCESLSDPLTVNLASLDTTELTVPAEAVIPASSEYAMFDVSPIRDYLPDSAQTAAVTAAASGFADTNAATVVLDCDAYRFSWAPIHSPCTAQAPFAVSVAALDINGLTNTMFQDSLILYGTSDGELSNSIAHAVSNAIVATGTGSNSTFEGQLPMPGSGVCELVAGTVHFDAATLAFNDDGSGNLVGSATGTWGWISYGDGQWFLDCAGATLSGGEPVIARYQWHEYLTSGTGPLSFSFTNAGASIDGVWTGIVVLSTQYVNVRLIAGDEHGHSGTSNPFRVASGPVAALVYEGIAPIQYANIPFALQIAAFDSLGNLVKTPLNLDSLTAFSGGTNPILSASFETGMNEFIIDNSFGSQTQPGLWHRSAGHGADSGHSPTCSLYYGFGETDAGGGNYNAGDTEGVVESPLVDLSDAAYPVILSFNHILQTEASPACDIATVEVSADGAPYEVVAGNKLGPTVLSESANWQSAAVDLSAYVGSQVRIRFHFDTLDEYLNGYEGWYVDDVRITAGDIGRIATQITPPDHASFSGGAWTGVVAVLQVATNVRLRAWTDDGSVADSSTFDVGRSCQFVFTTSGSGAVDTPCGWFPQGVTATVSAVACYSAFSGWTGDTGGCVYAAQTIEMPADRDRSVCAVFSTWYATNGVPQWWLAQHGWTDNFDTEATTDHDGDDMPTWSEYFAGTSPTNSESVLRIIEATYSGDVMRLSWKGGTNAVQIVERRTDLLAPGGMWSGICTQAPPTPLTNALDLPDSLAPVYFYRIRIP